MRCAVFGCNANNNKGKPNVRFYSFPKHNILRKQWIHFCRRKDNFNANTARICSAHFTADSFERNLQFEMGLCKNNGYKLKAGTIPTIQPRAIVGPSSRDIRMQSKATHEMIAELIAEKPVANDVSVTRPDEIDIEQNNNCITASGNSLEQENIDDPNKHIQILKREIDKLKREKEERKKSYKKEILSLQNKLQKSEFERLNMEKRLKEIFTADQNNSADDEDEEKMVESDVLEESEYDMNIIVSEDPVDTLIEEKTDEKDVRETPTRIFVSLLPKLQPNLGKTFDLKNKNKMLEKYQTDLADEGYNFSVKQVHSKYRTMERKYRLAKSRETKAGRKRKPIPYEKELDKLFGEESLCPQFSLDSTECEPSRETVVYSSLPRKNKSEFTHLKILRKLDEIRKEKAQFHADLLQRLDKKEQIEQERNELLKRIATPLENSFDSYA